MTEPTTTDSDVPTAENDDGGGEIAEPRHTPGPWSACDGASSDGCQCGMVWANGEVHVATAEGLTDPGHATPTEELIPANAQLIATAPELSAALHNLIREAEDAADALEALGDDGDAGMLRVQIEQAKRILNKARGAV